MKRLMVLLVVALLTSSMLLFAGQINMKAEADYPLDSIYVVPSQVTFTTNNASLGTLFNVTVGANMQSDTFGWQVEMTFNPAVVQIVDAGYTDVSSSVFFENFTYIINISPRIDNVTGSVLYAESLLAPEVAPQTNASLCWVEFEIVSVPSSTVTQLTTTFNITDSQNTVFENSEGNYIPLTYFNGQYAFIYVPPPGVHDVAVTDVVPYKTVVGQGYGLNVTVTAADPGDYTETFNVTVYANTTYAASQNVTLSSGNSTNLMFIWDTTGFAYGNYTLSAYAWPVAGETNVANNNCTGSTVYVGIPGDVNSDGHVNILDAVLTCMAFGSTSGSPNWNPNADVNNDGTVNMLDLLIVANHFGQHYP